MWVGRSPRPVSDATVTRGIAGFGADHPLRTTSLVDMAVRLPVKIEFIETAEKGGRAVTQTAGDGSDRTDRDARQRNRQTCRKETKANKSTLRNQKFLCL